MILKRVLDLGVAVPLAVVTAPLVLLVAAALLVTTRCALYRSERAGRGGTPFTLLKFVTMRPAAGPDTVAGAQRLRVTRLGRLLRATKLDELPQLLNVLRGDMSLVGPRPELRRYVDLYPDDYAVLHRVRPGLTGPASVRFRHEEALIGRAADPERYYADVVLPAKIRLDREYVEAPWRLGTDLALLGQTVAALFRRSGWVAVSHD